MKITDIERTNKIYTVTFEPRWIERLFGVKTKRKSYKDSGNEYLSGRGTVYYKSDGSKLPPGSWIGKAMDRWQNQF